MIKNEAPLITIGITAYNAEDTIADAINSALGQNWPNFEIVIVDDFSTDKTRSVIDRFTNPLIKHVYHHKNSGVAAARNTILKNANGEFVAFFDDDDISAPERLMSQYQALSSAEKKLGKKTTILCHTPRIQKYRDGKTRIENPPGIIDLTKPSPPAPPSGKDMAARILWGKPFTNGAGSMATCSQFARLSTYRDLSGFDETFSRSEDTDLAVRHALNGGAFIAVNAPLVIQSMTMANDKTIARELEMMLKLLEKHRNFIEENYNFSFAKKWTEAKFKYLSGQKWKFACAMAGLFIQNPILTIQRILWAFPNIGFNRTQKEFHNGNKP